MMNTFWNPNGLKHRCGLQGVNRVPDVVQAPCGRFGRLKGNEELNTVKSTFLMNISDRFLQISVAMIVDS